MNIPEISGSTVFSWFILIIPEYGIKGHDWCPPTVKVPPECDEHEASVPNFSPDLRGLVAVELLSRVEDVKAIAQKESERTEPNRNRRKDEEGREMKLKSSPVVPQPVREAMAEESPSRMRWSRARAVRSSHSFTEAEWEEPALGALHFSLPFHLRQSKLDRLPGQDVVRSSLLRFHVVKDEKKDREEKNGFTSVLAPRSTPYARLS